MKIAIFGLGAVGQPLGYILQQAGHTFDYYDKHGQIIYKYKGSNTCKLEFVDIESRGEIVKRCKLKLSTKTRIKTFSEYDLIIVSVGYLNISDVARVIKEKITGLTYLPLVLFLENFYEPEKLFSKVLPFYPNDKLIFGIPDIISYSVEQNFTRALYPFHFVIGNKNIVSKINDTHFTFRKDVKTAYLQRLCSHNTAHNMLAYLGHAKGYSYISEAIADKEIKRKMILALREGAAGLSYKYGISEKDQGKKIKEEVDKLLVQNFTDPIVRVARTPIKKLTSFERFTLPATLAYEAWSLS